MSWEALDTCQQGLMYLWRFGKGMGRKFTQWISSLLPHSLAEDPGWCLPEMLQLLGSLVESINFQTTAFQFTGFKPVHHLDLIVIADTLSVKIYDLMWGYFLWLILLCDAVQAHLQINLLQREIGCPELRCCYLSLKWEVPSLKVHWRHSCLSCRSWELTRCTLQVGDWSLQRKCSHVFPLMVCTVLLPMTSNFWSVFKLSGGRPELSRDEQHTPHMAVGGKQVLLFAETELRDSNLWWESHPREPWIV